MIQPTDVGWGEAEPETTTIEMKHRTYESSVVLEEWLADEVQHEEIVRLYNRTRLLRSFVNLFVQDVYNESVTYPADWWQALKERFFPRWALAWWPVKYTKHTFDVVAAYPGIKFPNRERAYIHTLETTSYLDPEDDDDIDLCTYTGQGHERHRA